MKKTILPIIAVFIFGISLTFFITDCTKKNDTENVKLEIGVNSYDFPGAFESIAQKTIQEDTGFPLDELIKTSGIDSPQSKQYIITGADGYQKTVSWDDLTQGIITPERKSVFEHLPKGFHVRDIIKIEIEQ